MTSNSDETYLGDGLYVRKDAYGAVVLRAPRDEGDHIVVLEPEVLSEFEAWLDKTFGEKL